MHPTSDDSVLRLRDHWHWLLGGALLLVLLVTLATGCATSSTLPKDLPVNPPKPQPSQLQPSEPYLSRAQKNIEAWLNQLKDMRTTP